jgi:hypothetical protein
MEVTSPRHVKEIAAALDKSKSKSKSKSGVLLQIGTRNAQNFELLKEVGQQQRFPALYKRGLGVSLKESLNAAGYIASEGNPYIVFCLRGVKSHLGDPHRNLVSSPSRPSRARAARHCKSAWGCERTRRMPARGAPGRPRSWWRTGRSKARPRRSGPRAGAPPGRRPLWRPPPRRPRRCPERRCACRHGGTARPGGAPCRG